MRVVPLLPPDRASVVALVTALALLLIIVPSAWAQESHAVEDPVDFIDAPGYVGTDLEGLEAAIEGALTPTDSVFPAASNVPPLAKAVLALETAEGSLPHARYSLAVYPVLVAAPPAADPRPTLQIQLDRYNLGPSVRAELAASLGAQQVAPVEEFGVGPHVSWRFVMTPMMGTEAALVAAARREISDDDAHLATCLGAPCLLPYSVLDEVAQWQPWDELESEGLLPAGPFSTVVDGLPTPTALVELVAVVGGFDAYEAEFMAGLGGTTWVLLERGTGQEDATEAALRRGDLPDDSVGAIWTRIASLAEPDGAVRFFTSTAVECQRGSSRWAAPGTFCP